MKRLIQLYYNMFIAITIYNSTTLAQEKFLNTDYVIIVLTYGEILSSYMWKCKLKAGHQLEYAD